MSRQAGINFLCSFVIGAIFCSSKLKPALLNGATGAMFSLANDAADPILRGYFLSASPTLHERQYCWAAKCVVALTTTGLLMPALASLVGITLKVNLVWTAVFCILELAWADIENLSKNRSPTFFTLTQVIPIWIGRFRVYS
ncbi:MAG TPA: hypothetical protein VGM34_03220 [Chlamydiales bacterium]